MCAGRLTLLMVFAVGAGRFLEAMQRQMTIHTTIKLITKTIAAAMRPIARTVTVSSVKKWERKVYTI